MEKVKGFARYFVGVVLFLVGILGWFSSISQVQTVGDVVGVTKKFFDSRGGGHDEWFPTVRFKLNDGQEYEFTPPIIEQGGSKKAIGVGSRIVLHYEPGNPASATIHSPFFDDYLWKLLMMLGLVGLGIAAAMRSRGRDKAEGK